MHRLVLVTLLACAMSTPAAAAEDPAPSSLSTHDPTCPEGYTGPSVLVRVTGFKDRSGQLRVEIYPDAPGDFLSPGRALRAAGKVFLRIDIPTPQQGDGEVCVPLPHAGGYAGAVLHDRNGDGKLNPFSDGYGFPNNPRLGYSKPEASEAAFAVAEGRTVVEVVLNYWTGLSARPLRQK